MNICVTTINQLSGWDYFFLNFGRVAALLVVIAVFAGMIRQTLRWISEP